MVRNQLAESHPLRVRGLKPSERDFTADPEKVASFTGAWIETSVTFAEGKRNMSHPLRVRGLKQQFDCVITAVGTVASFTDATRSFFRAFKSSSFQST